MIVRATPAAERVAGRVVELGREELVMVLGTGCCDSTAPYLYDHYWPGPDMLQVGRVAGVPVFAHRWLADLYEDGGLLLDVDEDVPNDSFSLESEFDCRFNLHAERPPQSSDAPAEPFDLLPAPRA